MPLDMVDPSQSVRPTSSALPRLRAVSGRAQIAADHVEQGRFLAVGRPDQHEADGLENAEIDAKVVVMR